MLTMTVLFLKEILFYRSNKITFKQNQDDRAALLNHSVVDLCAKCK